jgi:hypothetical protein
MAANPSPIPSVPGVVVGPGETALTRTFLAGGTAARAFETPAFHHR